MRILISGANGFVGHRLSHNLKTEGHAVVPLTRSAQGGVTWDPQVGRLSANDLEGFDAVFHLAGESIAEGRWTADKKARIRNSRVRGTQLLADTITKLNAKPKVLICASAVGLYGERGDERLTEQSAPGKGFLPDVCQAWEAATKPAASAGVRVVNARFGVILGKEGGALPKMLLPFKFGVGGKIGSGRQFLSWVTVQDVVRALLFALTTETLKGPINVTAPEPVTNIEFTKALGSALSRPTIFPLPAPVARLVMGEMADALLLCSTRVLPRALQDAGFKFQHPEIRAALKSVIS